MLDPVTYVRKKTREGYDFDQACEMYRIMIDRYVETLRKKS